MIIAKAQIHHIYNFYNNNIYIYKFKIKIFINIQLEVIFSPFLVTEERR